MPENSPADSVVGTVICRTVGALQSGGAPFTGAQRIHRLGRAHIVGEAKLHRLGTVGDRAAADGDDQIGLRLARLFRGGDYRRRGVCGGIRSNTPTQRLPSARADLGDLVGLAVQRAADHQEHALRAARLFSDRLRRGLRRTAPPPSG